MQDHFMLPRRKKNLIVRKKFKRDGGTTDKFHPKTHIKLIT